MIEIKEGYVIDLSLSHDELQCRILSLQCDFVRKEAWLKFPDGDCCDMNGAIVFE